MSELLREAIRLKALSVFPVLHLARMNQPTFWLLPSTALPNVVTILE